MRRINRDWVNSIWKAFDAGQRMDWADFEWYALDRAGAIGMLTSAGMGAIPRSAFRDMDGYLAVVDYFWQISQFTSARMFKSYPRVDDWRHAAECGLYGFNYHRGNSNADGYFMIACPEEALPLDRLPTSVRQWLEGMRLEQADFSKSTATRLNLSGSLEWLR